MGSVVLSTLPEVEPHGSHPGPRAWRRVGRRAIFLAFEGPRLRSIIGALRRAIRSSRPGTIRGASCPPLSFPGGPDSRFVAVRPRSLRARAINSGEVVRIFPVGFGFANPRKARFPWIGKEGVRRREVLLLVSGRSGSRTSPAPSCPHPRTESRSSHSSTSSSPR